MADIDPAASALLIIDVQNGFVRPEHAGLVERMAEFATRWQVAGGAVVLTRFVNQRGGPYERLLEWHKMYGPPETDIAEPLGRLPVPILDKHVYSGLTEELRRLAIQSGWQTFLLAGLDTEACVAATAFDILAWDRKPYLLADLCASSGGSEYHDAAVKALTRGLGYQQVGQSADVLSAA